MWQTVEDSHWAISSHRAGYKGPIFTRTHEKLIFVNIHRSYYEVCGGFPIPDQSAETCANVNATQRITMHCSGPALKTDQGGASVSAFFSETCRILKVKKCKRPLKPRKQWTSEKFSRIPSRWSVTLYWVGWYGFLKCTIFLLAKRSTPNRTTKYSQFNILYSREMNMLTECDLKGKWSLEVQNSDWAHRVGKLKIRLRKAYEAVTENNRKSNINKLRHDKKANEMQFYEGDILYLFSPIRKRGQCQKFRKLWHGLFKIIERLSSLQYRIVDMKRKKPVVHVNRLKKSHNECLKPKNPFGKWWVKSSVTTDRTHWKQVFVRRGNNLVQTRD